ncbi:hypothetical protein SO802_026761 [Lithocarpus litseifolius]|uniref:CRIB domain-containing protein n=1 Tax=Lithocarpus litseifolius TaxID=425828 RepID=A0AAW2C0R3_9ROSI
MATKVKGIFKGLRYISQIFDEKEPEMQIGYPTDVKHVAHIGWDGPSADSPSWMREYKSTQEDSSGTLDSFGEAKLSFEDKKPSGPEIQEPLLRNIRSSSNGSPGISPRWSLDAQKSSRHHSLMDSSDSPTPSPSPSSTTRHTRRLRNLNHGHDSPSQDSPPVPKYSRRRKSKGSSGSSGGSIRSSRSKGQNSLPDIPFSDTVFGPGSGHDVKNNESNLNSVLEEKEEGGVHM